MNLHTQDLILSKFTMWTVQCFNPWVFFCSFLTWFFFGSDLDENLQNAFHKHLEIRGIKPSTTNVLFDYMANKDNKEYLLWLKNLKNFVEM